MDASFNLKKACDYLQNQIDLELLPGAVLYVSYRGAEICKQALGYKVVHPDQERMTQDTVFDLASLTKVVATLPSVLKLVDEGILHLHDPVSYYLPSFAQQGKEQVKLIHLLTHTSGLAADRTFHLERLTKEQVYEAICESKLECPTGEKVVYSDLGMMLFAHLIEQVTKQSFEDFVRENIFEPLDMHETGFNPRFDYERYAATEYCSTHQAYKRGIVHDEKAESIGGVSGHAGLFSTIDDLAKYASMIENYGLYKGKQILSSAAVQLARRSFTDHLNKRRGLGWELNALEQSASCGELFSPDSYGHTGFTGTSLWFDSQIPLHVILLTNRVHYGRVTHIQRIRPRLHNLIRSNFNHYPHNKVLY